MELTHDKRKGVTLTLIGFNKNNNKKLYDISNDITLTNLRVLLVLFIFLIIFIAFYFTINKNQIEYDIIDPSVIENYEIV